VGGKKKGRKGSVYTWKDNREINDGKYN